MMRAFQTRRTRGGAIGLASTMLLALLLLWLPAGQGHAQPATGMPLRVDQSSTGVTLAWEGAVSRSVDGAPTVEGWPSIALDGRQWPATLVALQLPMEASLSLAVEGLLSEPWQGTLHAATLPARRVAGETWAPLGGKEGVAPATPVTLLREGRLRGSRFVVLAVTPLYEIDGELHAATRFHLSVPGASIASAEVLADARRKGGPFLTGASGPQPLAERGDVLKVQVTAEGIQRILGRTLEAEGWDSATLDPSRIHLWHNGEARSLEEIGTGDGRLDPTDELRFYATSPGDRWNSSDSYWLSIESSAGMRMASRSVAPGGATVRTTALHRGSWTNNTVYESTLPGNDGDHWFATDMRAGGGGASVAYTAFLPSPLPLATGSSRFTIYGSAATTGTHRLSVEASSASELFTWQGKGAWVHEAALSNNPSSLLLTLIQGPVADRVLPERIEWERPVTLNASGAAIRFVGVEGSWRYQVAAPPATPALYDVSDPARPVRLTGASGSPLTFQDSGAGVEYALTGPVAAGEPGVASHNPIGLSAPLNAEALYIAPVPFMDEVEPLAAYRGGQGYSSEVVSLQAIYDGWSYGQVSPDAIRDFLRYAAASWQQPPIAVTLVGDGTYDPKNFSGRNSPTWLPPYLAPVDRWLLETACENCFVQLDGEDPLSDLLPDLYLGRLPAKSEAEVTALVEKVLNYERQRGGVWRDRMAFITDNAFEIDGSPDPAGNFYNLSETLVAMQPPDRQIERMYYDPLPVNPGSPWHYTSAEEAHARTVELIDEGAGFLNFIGHSHQWQWAFTDPSATPTYLLNLFDVDTVSNERELPIVLSLTCLTSAFHTPAYSGTSLDERLLMFEGGGAAAVWGSTGLGVTYGHDKLAEGFYERLWEGAEHPPLGELTAAGYSDLFTTGVCCQSALQTFALLGDPLTVPNLATEQQIYAPFLTR